MKGGNCLHGIRRSLGWSRRILRGFLAIGGRRVLVTAPAGPQTIVATWGRGTSLLGVSRLAGA